jgi:hypothetical protein
MAHSTPDDGGCPVCGEPYERRLLVERGDDWGDLYPGSPLEFFRRFDRRCTADHDAERGVGVGGDALAVYLHGGRDRFTLF